MASLNRVMLIGNLGRDPEVTYTPAGLAITKFSVATTEKIKDVEKTEWHRITTFGKTAENCERFLFKGSQVYLEGRLQTSEYEKDGIKRYSTDIIANVVTFLSKAPAQNNQQSQPQQPSHQGYGINQPQGNGAYNQNQAPQNGGYGQGQGGGYNNAPQHPQQNQGQGFANSPIDDIPF
jgi:single-strand DNA-binding protein